MGQGQVEPFACVDREGDPDSVPLEAEDRAHGDDLPHRHGARAHAQQIEQPALGRDGTHGGALLHFLALFATEGNTRIPVVMWAWPVANARRCYKGDRLKGYTADTPSKRRRRRIEGPLLDTGSLRSPYSGQSERVPAAQAPDSSVSVVERQPIGEGTTECP
jgi:hypothetical protein